MSPTSVLPNWLEQATKALQASDINGWMTIYDPDATHEFPFAPDGAPRVLIGREAIGAYMSQLPTMIHFGALSDVAVREAGDELIVEATGHHLRVSDNAAREISYVWIITLRDGKVRRFRDYMNPLQLSKAVVG